VRGSEPTSQNRLVLALSERSRVCHPVFTMSAEVVGMLMPAVVTLDGLVAMNASDLNGHR
jgi:hypothetical protein